MAATFGDFLDGAKLRPYEAALAAQGVNSVITLVALSPDDDAALAATGVASITASGSMISVLDLNEIDSELDGFDRGFSDGTCSEREPNSASPYLLVRCARPADHAGG